MGESYHIYYYYCHLLLLFLCIPTISVNSLHIDKCILRTGMTRMPVKFVVPNTSHSSPSAVSYTQSWFEPSGWRAKLRLSSYPAVLVSLSIPVTPPLWYNSSWSSQIWECLDMQCHVGPPSLQWEWGFCICSFITRFYIIYLLSFDTEFSLET